MADIAERDNSGKLSWHNFPMFLLKPLMGVAVFGAKKYAAFNFLKGGKPVSEYIDAMKRHIEKFENPMESDIDESGENHLAHVAWNALVAIYMLDNNKCTDDRYKLETKDVRPSGVHSGVEQGPKHESGSGDSGQLVEDALDGL